MIKVAFYTLGCKVNQYETEAIRESFRQHGAAIVPSEEPADVYIVNTCTVTNMADRKSRQLIRRMKKINPDALMVVTGCYAQVASEDLEKMPDVDLIVGNNLKSEIVPRVYELLEGGPEQPERTEILPYRELAGYEDMGIITASETDMSRAYIKIQEGCNRFCSYCLIPYARGNVRSRPLSEILEEAEMLLGEGFHELVLTGINTALYGAEEGFDFDRRPDEAELSGLEAVVRRLDEMDGDFRIRLSSLEPTVVDIGHIERIVRYDRLCHHLHLALQSGSDSVLRSMNRHYTKEEYLRIVNALREYDPDFGITTDIIVGFPGETEADFEETMDVVRRSGFGRTHIFRYSSRKGTRAADFSNMVPGSVRNERAHRLEALSEEVAREFEEKNYGRMHSVLIEKTEDGFATGYTENYIRVYIPDAERRLQAGTFRDVRLIEHYKDGCLAETAEQGRR